MSALTDMLDKEVAATGASYTIEPRGKHQAVMLSCCDGRTRMVVVSRTASDHRALLNIRGDVRRTLRGMAGA